MPSRSTLTTTGRLVEVAEMEHLEPEYLHPVSSGLSIEADVAPAVEIEVRQAVGSGESSIEGAAARILRPPHDVLVAERRRVAAAGASVWRPRTGEARAGSKPRC